MKRPTHPFGAMARGFGGYARRVWPAKISVVAAEEFNANFDRQGYQDQAGRTHQWPGRKIPAIGKQRAVLVQSGRLRRSLRPQPMPGRARVIAQAPYATLHHNGGSIKITPAMRRYFWAMFYKWGGGKAKGMSKRSTALNSLAKYYRALALAQGPLKIPARPFMITSLRLRQRIETQISNDIKTLFKHY